MAESRSDPSGGDPTPVGDPSATADGDADGSCSLCDLPIEDPVTADDVTGAFCCRGCLAVARRLDAVDDAPAAGDAGTSTADALETGADDAAGAEAFLAVDGMHCSTCEAFVEATATDHDGVRAAEASYATDLARVVYDADALDADDLPGLVSGAGYDARLVEDADDVDGGVTQRETQGRLIVGGIFGMMTMLWYALFLYPVYLGGEALFLDLSGVAGTYLLWNLWAMATIVLGYTGYPILRGAYVSLRAGEPNMDLLVSVAAGTAYLYSAAAVLLGHTEVYFDVSVVVVVAVTVGSYYEGRVKERASGALAERTAERVTTARRRTPDGTEEVSLDDVETGDELVVRQGERVPLDGRVVEGTAAVDEALVTGESVPVRKAPGEAAVGGAEVTDGALVVEVTDAGANTLDRITHRLWELQSGRGGVQRLADRLAGVFVPLAVTVAVAATLVHLATGADPTGAVLTGLAVLVVSCPCALGLATPLSVAAGVREGLAEGIVVTDPSLFEREADPDVVAFDKTGTLTTGDLTLDARPDDDLLAAAAALERFADHPLARAVESAVPDPDAAVTDLEQYPGRGVGGCVDGTPTLVGTPDLFEERGWDVPGDLRERFETARAEAAVAALVGQDGAAADLVTATDRPRENWERVVDDLAADHEVVVVTGDAGAAADRFREHDAVSEVFAGVPPEGKGALVERLRSRGTVAMVGDGSNDAPALAAADVGIALASGTALATEAADAVVTTDDLAAVPRTLALARATRRRVRGNVGWALCYNAVAVPAAALGLLNPLVAAVAMATSSLLVVGNASRSLLGTGE